MGEKVKVSREVAEAIESAFEVSNKEQVLEDHARSGMWQNKEFLPLNNLSLLEMAAIVINGYEIEETPEEKFLRVYKMQLDINRLDFADGMKYALETLGIKIKGIND